MDKFEIKPSQMSLPTPQITSDLRKNMVLVPDIIKQHTTGISMLGKKIHSLLFSTDIAIIRNTNADAIIAVYPFTPHPTITQAIMNAADIPVLCGVGGGLTSGVRSVNIALHAEFQGALAVVLNGPTPESTISAVKETVGIPVIVTIVSELVDHRGKLAAGADILNVSGGAKTPDIVAKIRRTDKNVPIIATGGTSEAAIMKTIEAGANAITFTPPSSAELFKVKMEKYRVDEIDRLSK